MNRDAAVHLITQTFDSPFDDGRFERLAGNLLNTVDRSRAFASRHGAYIPKPFQGHVRQYKRPFIYTDPNGERLDVLIVRLHSESSLDRARTMQRNFIAWYLKQTHAEPVDAALVAFYSDESSDWRFSLVRLEYAFGEAGVEEKLTPARRYSYLVGPDEPSHTAAQQLLPLLLEDRRAPTLDELTDAFQVEMVSKQFFEGYKALFLRLLEALEEALDKDPQLAHDFQRADIHPADFAKKLLGQIVFLYFVQKKGWLGVEPEQPWGTGSRGYLRGLFDKRNGVDYDNFFDDILEPLFYDALAIQRADDLFTLGGCTCKVPFLNGGLFEPMGGYDWRRTHLRLPDGLFSNREAGDDGGDGGGNGILDIFDRYNFTVREEEPLEKEVAVDPEMLGKVFENLLGVRDRKSKGAFYTPREIVHYMCQESLIEYLDTAVNGDDDKVRGWQGDKVTGVPREEVTTLVRRGALALEQDAAKEAGLQKGDYVLPPRVRAEAPALDRALAAIKLCDPAIGSGAFPVGMLHEIIQARLALDTRLKRGVTSYDLKRHAIQESIYGVDIDAGAVEIAKLRLWLSLVVDEEAYDTIQPLPNLDYKIVQGNSLGKVEKNLFNVHLFADLDALKRRFFDETHPQEKLKLRAQIDLLIGQLTNGQHDFDFEIYFHEVFEDGGGFDVMVGNPPYVRQEKIRALKPLLKQTFPEVYAGTADLYTYFYAQGVRILREQGTLAYISSNKFMRAGYGKKLRRFLGTQTSLHTLIDFGDLPVFDATAYPVIVITRKRKPGPEDQLLALNVNSLDVLQSLPLVMHDLAWPIPQRALRAEGWALERPEVLALMEKLRSKGTPLEKYIDGKFYRGVVTGYNQAFVIDETTRQRLIEEDPRSAEVIKPWLRGKDIKRWRVDWRGLYVIAIQNSGDADASNPWGSARSEEEAWSIFKRTYPAFHDYLTQYESALRKRQDQGRYWWELRACAYYLAFEKPKIVYPDIAKHSKFVYDQKGFFGGNTLYFVPTDKLFLLAILNSTVVEFFYARISASIRGAYLRFFTHYMSQIPIPDIRVQQRDIMNAFVRKLLDAQGNGPQVAAWERELNEIVYGLYDLTDEEIALIEAETVANS